MKKRIGSLLLILALCFTLLPTAALATDNSADTWDGTADTNWYVGHEADPDYHITTAEQLAGLAKLVNADPGKTNFAGKTFYLENDLDLSGHEWISIGTVLGGDYPEYSFCGVFDGRGHVISNLYSHESYIQGADESHNLLRNALFGSVYNGEVKNLGVADAEIWIDPKDDSAAGKGILVDWMGKSKIKNCWTSGSIYSGTKIEKNIGGIVGITMQGCTISGCYSTATLTGNFTNSEGYYKGSNPAKWPTDTIGGIVGARFDGDLTVTDCWFDGKIVVNSIQAAVGGIVGCANIATVNNSVGGSVGNANIATKNCMVTTTDMGADKGKKTCWVAYAPDKTVKNCYWPNDETYNPSLLADVGGASNGEQGTAVSDFTSADVLAGLQKNASADVKWVAGIKHPTFEWDKYNISANYSEVDEAIAKADALDKNKYKDFSAVEKAIADVVRGKNITQQTEVDAMVKAIEDAIAALQLKYSGGGSYIPKDNVTNNPVDKSTTADLTPVVKGDKAETTVDAKTADKIVDKAVENKSTEVIVDAKGNNTVASSEVAIPEKTVKEISEKTDANLVIKTDNGKVDLDKTALEAVAAQAGNTGFVRLIIETIKSDENICHVNLKLITSNGAVKDFKGGNVKVTIPLDKGLAAKDVVCVYINDNGIYTLVNGQKNSDGTYTFTTGHFSEYAVMAKDEADKVIAEQLNTLIKEVNLKVRTSKTAKKNIKAVVSGDITALTDAGYTVKYKFYKSTKKASKYKAVRTKDTNTYINTAGKKGTKYYYKAKAMVYSGDKLAGQTVLKQCKYGVRTWSK